MAENDGKNGYFVGVDFGGTKILGGVFNTSLQLRGTAKASTKAQRGPEAVMERVARCVRDAVDEADLSLQEVRAVGVGAPGAVDGEEGRVIFAPNLNWHDVPLRQRLQELLGLPVFVENDCNLATLAVHVVELKSKPRSLVGIFIGTGIGGGLIVEGELFAGYGHTAGEVGHMIVDLNGPKCSCGNHGCFEALASRTAIFERVKAAIHDGQTTVLAERAEDVDRLRSGDLRKAVRRGDKVVKRVVAEAAQHTGVAVANLVNILNPEVVVLGGGVIEALAEEMLGIIVDQVKDRAMPGAMDGVEIVASTLGDKAGITGGAVLARRMTK